MAALAFLAVVFFAPVFLAAVGFLAVAVFFALRVQSGKAATAARTEEEIGGREPETASGVIDGGVAATDE